MHFSFTLALAALSLLPSALAAPAGSSGLQRRIGDGDLTKPASGHSNTVLDDTPFNGNTPVETIDYREYLGRFGTTLWKAAHESDDLNPARKGPLLRAQQAFMDKARSILGMPPSPPYQEINEAYFSWKSMYYEIQRRQSSGASNAFSDQDFKTLDKLNSDMQSFLDPQLDDEGDDSDEEDASPNFGQNWA